MLGKCALAYRSESTVESLTMDVSYSWRQAGHCLLPVSLILCQQNRQTWHPRHSTKETKHM